MYMLEVQIRITKKKNAGIKNEVKKKIYKSNLKIRRNKTLLWYLGKPIKTP